MGLDLREIKYEFTRKIEYVEKEGLVLEHPDTGESTGFIRDIELARLKKGEKLVRVVEDMDGDNGFATRLPRPADEPVVSRLFKIESAGELRDTISLPKYPFEVKDSVQIRLEGGAFNVGDLVTIKIRYIKTDEVK